MITKIFILSQQITKNNLTVNKNSVILYVYLKKEENMNNIDKILNSKEVLNYYDTFLTNNWKGTPFEKYQHVDPKQKGILGEMIVEKVMLTEGHDVKPPINKGHDRIINNEKIEIKFGLAISPTCKKTKTKLIEPDNFMFNHIASDKDWDKFIFFGINPDKNNINTRKTKGQTWPKYRIYTMTKRDFLSHISGNNTYPFKRQQGGKKSNNDDYIVAGKQSCADLFALPFVKEYKGAL